MIKRTEFNTTVNNLPYKVVAVKFDDGREIVTVSVERNGKWAMLNGHNHRFAVNTAKQRVAEQINEFFGAR